MGSVVTNREPEMDPRQQRGLEIATQFRVRRTIGGWVVPSQSGSGKYAVIMSATPTCTCLDFGHGDTPGHGDRSPYLLAELAGIQLGADERKGSLHGAAPRSLPWPVEAATRAQA